MAARPVFRGYRVKASKWESGTSVRIPTTFVPFSIFQHQSTLFLSSSGGGLPRRLRLKLSRDACFAFGPQKPRTIYNRTLISMSLAGPQKSLGWSG